MSTHSPPRSLLAVPAGNPRFLQSALHRQADAVMPDLEDAVSPDAKDTARSEIVRFLRGPATTADARLMVRVNDPMSELGRQDLDTLAPHAGRLDGVVIPRSGAESVAAVRRLLDVAVVALIETAASIEEAYDIARQHHVAGLLFGSVDYTAELSSRGGWHIRELGWAKSRIVNAAAAGGTWALAGPWTLLDDHPGLQAEIEIDRTLGFAGKLCIHPAQVAVVNDAFAPSREHQRWAQRVLDALGTDADPGVVRIDGQMIDRPLIDQARRIVNAAEAVTA